MGLMKLNTRVLQTKQGDFVICNAKGDPIAVTPKGQAVVLNKHELYHARWLQRHVNSRFGNSLGYEVPITTLTTIVKKISMQKFFEIAPADYLPIKVGEGTWSSNLTTYRSFVAADQFESGIINTGADNARLSTADAGVDALNIKVQNWAKETGWNIFDLELAAKSGNWELVSAKEEARKKNWDLGIQRIAFLGARGLNSGTNAQCLGLFNQPGVTFNASLITGPLSGMSYSALATLIQTMVKTFRINNNYTAYPSHWIIPEDDFNGLAAQSSPQFPVKSILQLLEEALKVTCRNANFKILPNAYASYSNAGGALPSGVAGGANSGLYVLLKYDESSVRMDVPLMYTNTLAMSLNNFQFQNAAYGQFTGVLAYRPLEMMYMGF